MDERARREPQPQPGFVEQGDYRVTKISASYSRAQLDPMLEVLGAIAVGFATGVVKLANLSQVTTLLIIIASVAYFATMLTSSRVEAIERTRVRAFIPLFIANAVFWSLFQQIFTVLAVYSDERINWTIFGWTAPSSWIGSIEPVWIILLSPLFAVMWTKLGRRAPTTPRKFAYGVIGMGAAFLLFLPMAGGTGKTVPVIAVVAIMAAFAISELMLSPIGLSVTTQLAPNAFRSQMMALYFFSVGLGTAMSGVLARYYDSAHEAAYFGIIGGAAGAAAGCRPPQPPKRHQAYSASVNTVAGTK